MRVVFDASPALFAGGGTYTYTQNLARSLQALSALDDIDLSLSWPPAWLEPNGAKGLKHKLRVMAWDSFYMHVLLPLRARSLRADLVHTPAVRLPFRASVPVITTIFDVTPFIFPQLFRMRDRLMLGFYLWVGSRRATHIITISEQSRQDIHRYLKVSLDRIDVTYPGVSLSFHPVEPSQVVHTLARYGIEPPFILSVGTLEPRKNLLRVLHMFAALKRTAAVPHQLVLVGRRGWLDEAIFEQAQQLEVADAIRFTGFVPEADLVALYSGASVFVYPSLYEGFGMPPLEAMACGCPVVTSNTSSLPEVVGDAAMTANPLDGYQLADAVCQVLEDESLARSMHEKGLEQARHFSWQRCAQGTIAVYQRVLNR